MRKILVIVALLAVSSPAAAQVHSIGPVSFVVPDGMTYEEKGDSATMGRVENPQSFVLVAIALPQPSVGDAEANFRSLWKQIAQTDPPQPIYGITSKGGYGGKYGATSCKPKMNCLLFTLETGKGVVPVFALTPEGQPDWSFFWPIHQSVRMSPAKARPPKKNLTVADMVGKWSWGASSTRAYVSSSGYVVGTDTNAVGSTYIFAADGSYTVTSSGIVGNRTFKEQSSGRVEFTPEVIIFHEKSNDKRYRFISYVESVDGSTIMTLLNASYEANSTNISMYAEDFVKAN